MAAFGRVDLLVNSAGGSDMPALFHELDGARLEAIVQDGLMWVLQSCRAALPHMAAQRGGVIGALPTLANTGYMTCAIECLSETTMALGWTISSTI